MLTDFDLSKSAASTVQPGMVKNMVVSGGKGKTPQLVNKPDIVTNSFVGTEEYIAPEGAFPLIVCVCVCLRC